MKGKEPKGYYIYRIQIDAKRSLLLSLGMSIKNYCLQEEINGGPSISSIVNSTGAWSYQEVTLIADDEAL